MKFLAVLLLLNVMLFSCTERNCIGDCSFDISADIGLLIHQPADFNNTRVKIKIPSGSLSVAEGMVLIKYRDIEKKIPAKEAILTAVESLPEKDVNLFFDISGGIMTLSGISY